MGYESKIYLALTNTQSPTPHLSAIYSLNDDGEPDYEAPAIRHALFSEVVGMIDLCKTDGAVHYVIRKAIQAEKDRLALSTPDKPVYGFGIYTSGDEFEDRDRYDDPVSPVPLDDLLAAVEVGYSLDAYRRYGLAQHLLRGWRDMLSDFGGPQHARILHFGH
jgi:hypothetical protein